MAMVRESNFELLRIIAMLLVLVVHITGGVLGLPDRASLSSLPQTGVIFFESVGIICVNLFVLVSGYFGIRTTGRKIAKYLLICGTYGVGVSLYFALLTNQSVMSVKWWTDNLLFISHTDLWFVSCYFYLMLLCPLLNAGIDNLSKNELRMTLISLLVISCWFGWWNEGRVNLSGYNLVQMVTLYVTGRYIRLYGSDIIATKPLKTRYIAILAYLISLAAIMFSTALLSCKKGFAYNPPFVLSASVAFFYIFATIHFRSRLINGVAVGAFAVYLIHKHPVIWQSILLPWWRSLAGTYSGWLLVTTDFCAIITVFIVCVFIDRLRIIVVSLCVKH